MEGDFAFTGHYYHGPSSLHLTLYRAYDADTGRWLSQDPIGETGGANLYGYTANNPVGSVDPYGLTWALFDSAAWKQLAQDIFIGDRPASLADPNSYLAMRGVDNYVGRTPGELVGDVGGAVLEGVAYSALGMIGPGEAEGAYQAGNKLLQAARAAKQCELGANVLPVVNKAVNSNLAHAAARAAERNIFATAREAADALRALSETITKDGFPAGTLPDTARADRVLVPIGSGGMADYQVGGNGTAVLKTVLVAH